MSQTAIQAKQKELSAKYSEAIDLELRIARGRLRDAQAQQGKEKAQGISGAYWQPQVDALTNYAGALSKMGSYTSLSQNNSELTQHNDVARAADENRRLAQEAQVKEMQLK